MLVKHRLVIWYAEWLDEFYLQRSATSKKMPHVSECRKRRGLRLRVFFKGFQKFHLVGLMVPQSACFSKSSCKRDISFVFLELGRFCQNTRVCSNWREGHCKRHIITPSCVLQFTRYPAWKCQMNHPLKKKTSFGNPNVCAKMADRWLTLHTKWLPNRSLLFLNYFR